MTLLIGSLQLGFLYSIMVLGIYISFRILNIPDLTTEGSFTFGLAASSILTAAGHPLLGLVGALIAGALAGSVTGFLQTKLDIHPVLAGILTMSGLYSINLFVMGGASNVTLLNNDTVFTLVLKVFSFMSKDAVKLFVAIAAVVIVTVLLTVFFKTSLGLSIRATGDNADMVRASSINVDAVKMIALAISNACVGILVVGLASVIIGEAFFGHRSLMIGFISAIVGSIIYRYIIALATKSDMFPAYMLKLISAIIVTVALAVPAIKAKMANDRLKRNGMRESDGGR